MSAAAAASLALARRLKEWIVVRSLEAQVGHVGSALSIADVMAVLWAGVLRAPGTSDPGRDRFILSKGHAALALYGVLHDRGLIDDAAFASFCRDGSLLGVHPDHELPGVDVSTGSLGQGLSVGCGLAYGLRARGSEARVFVLLSDAECNEGQVWEAAMFAAHHRLGGLCAVVDDNGQQALGFTADVLAGSAAAERWAAFGWRTAVVDGHDHAALGPALAAGPPDRPTVVIARTVLGKGVSFMERRIEWHYRNLTAELAEQARRELRDAP